ncbi:hypothetical protein AVEN_127077-1 [Araneus ventricosus]|uniref:EB domain-containing protein n=1 Tax=Araneus ventricosus TaxID=182803 RepID=A0A4Y2MV06_ARAVE|nr:hypothetical protein AVEN_127077-1 [Araneus ventricosus]
MKIINFYGVNCLSIFLILLLQAEGLSWTWSNLFGFTQPKDGPGEYDRINITCQAITDCTPSINGSICANGFCDCPEEMPIFVNAMVKFNMSYCLPALNLTQMNCSFNQQCNYENSECLQETCKCAEKFIPVDGKCKLEERTAMIPIIVGSIIAAAIIFTLVSYFIMSRRKAVT